MGGVAAVEALGRSRKAVGIVASVILVLVAVLLAAQDDGGDTGDVIAGTETPPHLVDGGELVSLGNSLGHSVYWAGEREGDQLELTEEADGNVYLRYLPPGIEAGDPRQLFLTVGTYPVADPVGSSAPHRGRGGRQYRPWTEGRRGPRQPDLQGQRLPRLPRH